MSIIAVGLLAYAQQVFKSGLSNWQTWPDYFQKYPKF